MDNLNNRYIAVRERIFAMLEEKSIQKKDFAKAIGVYTSTITDWKKGRSFSFVKRLNVIAQVLGTTEEWLLAGDSPDLLKPARKPEPPGKEQPTPKDGDGLSETQKEIMKCVRQMSSQEQEAFLAWLQASQGRN